MATNGSASCCRLDHQDNDIGDTAMHSATRSAACMARTMHDPYDNTGKIFMTKTLISCAVFAIACSLGLPAQAAKRGFAGDLVDNNDVKTAAKFGWYYNWGIKPNAGISGNVEDTIEYVPMAWNANYDRQALINYLTAHPRVKYLLAFNEPNFKQQANLTPTQAAAAWPQLQAIADQFHLTLVGPALNFGPAGGVVVENGVEYTDPVKWYDDFFAACKGCRVDHIAIHAYFDNAGALPWMIGLFDKYKKPIWLTEFSQSPSKDQQQFMKDAVSILENDPRIFRYAWFLARSSPGDNNQFDLFTQTPGVLTDLGKLYASLPAVDKANAAAPDGYAYAAAEGGSIRADGKMDFAYGAAGSFKYLYGVTTDRACNAATFGGDPIFGTVKACYARYTPGTNTSQTIQAEKYLAAGDVGLESTADTGGGQNVGWIDANDWMRYAPVSIFSAGTYTVDFRVASPNANQKLALVNQLTGATLATVTVPNTGGWQNWRTVSTTVSLPVGPIQFRIVAQTSGFNLNWFGYRR
jgi:hypothetical protein